jgi:hypothetical protein
LAGRGVWKAGQAQPGFQVGDGGVGNVEHERSRRHGTILVASISFTEAKPFEMKSNFGKLSQTRRNFPDGNRARRACRTAARMCVK